MLATALEFAPGTTDAAQKLVVGLFPPGEILSAYRAAKQQFHTSDLVLVASTETRELSVGTRADYIRNLIQKLGKRAKEFGVCHKSAHAVVQTPASADAMWFVVLLPRQEMPSMCVLFTTPYEVGTSVSDDVSVLEN